MPKLRSGVCSPEFLLQPCRRAEQALVAVICQAYVEGVSVRRVDGLVKAMGIEAMSRSEVSRVAGELDGLVGDFRGRPLDGGPYRYLWVDALTQRVREGGRVVNVSGGAAWQLWRTHFMANLASRVAKVSWPMVATLVGSIFEQPDRQATWNQLGDVVDKLSSAGFSDAANFVLGAADDILAFAAFPVEHWPKIRSNNPQERLNKEICRRIDVVGIFSNRRAVIRLLGAVLAGQTDEWAIGQRYMSIESLKFPVLAALSPNDPRPPIAAAGGAAG